MEKEKQAVYDVVDVQRILGLSRTTVYIWLEETYKQQAPFRVLKIGKLYKIPKDSFNDWLAGNCTNQKGGKKDENEENS